MASLAVIATDVLRWEIPPDAAPAISAEAMTSSFGASCYREEVILAECEIMGKELGSRLFHEVRDGLLPVFGIGDHALDRIGVYRPWVI